MSINKDLSRREFIMLFSAVTLAAEFAFVPENINSRNFEPYVGPRNVFPHDSAELVRYIRDQHNITIISPSISSDGDIPRTNHMWTFNEIQLLTHTIDQLPPLFFAKSHYPHEVLLYKTPGARNKGVGGGYLHGQVNLYLSEQFNLNASISDPYTASLYRDNQRSVLQATVVHEFTHAFVEDHPEVLQFFVRNTGWYIGRNGNWISHYPDNLIRYGGANMSPNEDLAVSAGLMFVNPTILSRDRRAFFHAEPQFIDWIALASDEER